LLRERRNCGRGDKLDLSKLVGHEDSEALDFGCGRENGEGIN